MKTEDQIKAAILWLEDLMTATDRGIGQTKEELGNKAIGFCCLGRACVVTKIKYRGLTATSSALVGKVGLLSEVGASHYEKIEPPITEEDDIGMLVSSWTRRSTPSCAQMNDKEGYSFKKISKRLQKYPNQYFLPEVAKGIKEHFA